MGRLPWRENHPVCHRVEVPGRVAISDPGPGSIPSRASGVPDPCATIVVTHAGGRGVDMGKWRERVLDGADGVGHAASCCTPDAWLTDRREEWDRPQDHASVPADEVAGVEGRVHVVGGRHD